MSIQRVSQAEALGEMIEHMPIDSTLTQHGISWEAYEQLLMSVGEASGLRISYDEGKLEIMTLSHEHEVYSTLIERIVDRLSSYLRIRVLFYGSATMKLTGIAKGVEPDACFYVQNAKVVSTKPSIDFETDPPPDVVVEIDIHHESTSKFPIYAAFCVPEIWRYDGKKLSMYRLRGSQYILVPASEALPKLSSSVLSDFLSRSPKEDQYDILIAFEEWLKTS